MDVQNLDYGPQIYAAFEPECQFSNRMPPWTEGTLQCCARAVLPGQQIVLQQPTLCCTKPLTVFLPWAQIYYTKQPMKAVANGPDVNSANVCSENVDGVQQRQRGIKPWKDKSSRLSLEPPLFLTADCTHVHTHTHAPPPPPPHTHTENKEE